MKRNEDNKVIFKVLVGFVLTFLLVVFMQYNKTMATGGVYYMNDLKIGDFIPSGSRLIADKYTIDSSGGFRTDVDVEYIKKNGSSIYDDFNSNEDYVVLGYYEVFKVDNNKYSGWVVDYTYNNRIGLKPANFSYVVNDSAPSKDNNYQLCAKCYEEFNVDLFDAKSYSWYKVEDLQYEYTSSLDVGDFESFDYGFEYFLNFRESYATDYEAKQNVFNQNLKFEFELLKGKILIFDSYIESRYYDSYIKNLDTGKSVRIYGGNYKYEASEDGRYSLEFSLRGDSYYYDAFSEHYIIFRNMKVLTPLNEGDKLDASLVSEGDEIYYKVECDNGYVLGDSFIYEVPPVEENPPLEEPEEVPPVDEPVIENPETNDYVKVIIFALMISLTVVIITFKRYKKLD